VAEPGLISADVASRGSAFLSSNHAVRFCALSPELPDISRVTAYPVV
jgi:hypothetical protein